jgi:hypothetical protein
VVLLHGVFIQVSKNKLIRIPDAEICLKLISFCPIKMSTGAKYFRIFCACFFTYFEAYT